jgi:hypothetical protein
MRGLFERGVIFEGQSVGCVGVADGSEAHSFVEACCAGVFGAETYEAEALSGLFYEGGDQCAAYSLVAPCGTDVDAADTACAGFGSEGVDGESADCDELAVVEVAAENFAWSFEAIDSAGPLVDERVDEVVAVFFASTWSASSPGIGNSIF